MSDFDGASAPADTGSIASNELVIAATPQPVSTEGEPAAQVAEKARQAEEARTAQPAKDGPKKATEPVAEKAKPLSAREALKAAAAKLEAAEKTPAKDAKATDEKAAPIKDAPQPRAEDGKFTAKTAEPASKADAQAVKADEATGKTDSSSVKSPASVDTRATTGAPKDAPAADKTAAKGSPPSYTAEPPPSRFSPDAKDAWASTPDPVRAEVHRAVKELTAGFEKHRAAAERDSSITEFHEMAAKGGTTVKEALSKYVGMENQLRADVKNGTFKGLEIICQNAGMSLREVAAKIMGQTPDQQTSQSEATMRELRAEIADLKKSVGGVTETFQQQRTQTTTEAVTKFATDHPRFEELSEDIAFFLKTKHPGDLAKAYEAASRLNPAPAKAQAEVPTPASSAAVAEVLQAAPAAKATPDLSVQTDRGSKSIAGAPTAGSDPVSRQPSKSIKESLRRAMAAAG